MLRTVPQTLHQLTCDGCGAEPMDDGIGIWNLKLEIAEREAKAHGILPQADGRWLCAECRATTEPEGDRHEIGTA